jgi:hypothetical protein
MLQTIIDTLQETQQAYRSFHDASYTNYQFMKDSILGNEPTNAAKCEGFLGTILSSVDVISKAGLSAPEPSNSDVTWNKLLAAYAGVYDGMKAANDFTDIIKPHYRQKLITHSDVPNLLAKTHTAIKISRAELDSVLAAEKKTRAAASVLAKELATGTTQEKFADWIKENRKAVNFWIFAGIEELIKGARGNRRFKFAEIVESRKDDALGAARKPIITPDAGAHSLVVRYGLQSTASMSLKEAFELIGAEYREEMLEKNIRRAVTSTGYRVRRPVEVRDADRL